ncbi:MAG: imidazole glycerol phosphate synthase subunit HisH [Ruminococcaceae bacterium]|nr:imidazole glycerol phosphate synthase subunit HisH [Oscillospiraceae bacterium]
MIAVIDYGVGNLFSLCASLSYLNIDSVVTNDISVLEKADKIILPGVGAFGDAYMMLEKTGLIPFLKTTKKPVLGICLGMQLLFDKSYEYGEHNGLGIIKGIIYPIKEDVCKDLKIPHMGWNSLTFKKESKLFKYVTEGSYVYYVHSFYAKDCSESIIATSDYGTEITGAVECNNYYGTQFHPEKSGKTGLSILKAFSEL